MYRTVVYDDGRLHDVIEEFIDDNELTVVRKATNAVKYLRSCGKQAIGRYTFRLCLAKPADKTEAISDKN